MWLYVPNLSTSSPSAPAEAGLISESSWQFPALEASVWWRGKPSPSRSWFQRSGKVSFIRLLCGAMPEPSTAAHGVEAWTASLAASRASRIALLDGSREATTSVISGPMPDASSSSRAHGSSSSRMSGACSRRGLTKSLEQSGYGETFASLVSRLRSDCSRRRKSARAMSVRGSSFSAWLTPSANEDAAGTVDGKMQRMLTHQAKETSDLWSTTRSSDGEKGGPNQAFGAGGMPLPAQTAQWATPQARDYMPPHSPERIAAMKAEGHGMRNLNDEAAMWPTPAVPNGGRSNASGSLTPTGKKADGSKGQVDLNFAATKLYSLPDQQTSTTGSVSSRDRRSLNPLFVEWLMGWPPGWTLLAWTDFACSATELSLFKQRMRSALSQLALPAEAPPAQLALFG